MSAVLRTQLAGVARRPARLLLTGLAVLVASFVVYATVLVQQITERSMLNGLSGTPEAVDLVVRDGALTGGQLRRIAGLPGVAEAVGRTEAGVQTGGQYFGVIADPGTGPLSLLQVRSGRFPSAAGEIAVTPRTADRMGLPVGATVTAQTTAEKPATVPLKVVGVVAPRDDFGFQAYAPMSTVLGLAGGDLINQIDVRLADGADEAAVRSGIEPLLSGDPRPTVATGSQVRHEEAVQAAEEVELVFAVVGMFIAIAVVAAGLIAASTFRIVFAQRVRQLALLRAVGAGRGGIARALAAEGALTGLVTGVTGVALALAAGHLAPPLLGAFGFRVSGPGVPVGAALGTVALAVLITVLAVLSPALSAARVAPLEALRSAATTGARRGIGVPRWIVGLALAALAAAIAGYVAANLPGRDTQDYDPRPFLLAVVASGGLAFLALIALGPVLVRPVLAVAGWPLRRLGPVGRLAVGGIGGSPRRAAAVSVVVALGVTLIAGVLVGGASIRMLTDRELASTAPADYELTGAQGVTLPAEVVQRAQARPELEHVTPYRRVDLKVDGLDAVTAADLSPSALPRLDKLDVLTGSLGDLGPGRAVLARYVAEDAGARVGEQVTLAVGGRQARLTVAAVLPDVAPLHAGVLLDPADLTGLGVPAAHTGLLADAAREGERGRTEGQQALRAAAGNTPGLGVAVLADERDSIMAGIAVVLAIALGLIGLTVLIAVVGVGSTTALSVVERVRESGLLRAVGMSRGALRAMLTCESALYGVVGAVLGLALGVPYAWLTIQSIGVNAPLVLPAWQLAAVFVALVALTALAGVLPARRAAKVSPVAALGAD